MEVVSWSVIVVIAVAALMMVPRRTNATMVLAIANVVIFAVTEIGYYGSFNWSLYELGFDYSIAAEGPWTLITSMFMHAVFFHLMFNMLFLIAIGIPLESRIGKARFIAIYMLGGMAGSVVFALVEMSASAAVILVGASGAISALLGAMIMLYPREKIMFFLGPLLTDRFSIMVPVLVWFSLQLILFVFDDSAVAYSAHLGGFAAGAAIAWVIRPRNAPYTGSYDISPLKALCTTHALEEMYDYAENARDAETRMIWTERILKDVRCPVCGSEIRIKKNGLECTGGHPL